MTIRIVISHWCLVVMVCVRCRCYQKVYLTSRCQSKAKFIAFFVFVATVSAITVESFPYEDCEDIRKSPSATYYECGYVATTLYLPIPEYIGNKFVQIKENGRELKIEIDVL